MRQVLYDITPVLDTGNNITFLRRMDGSVSFNKTWNEYRSGFGNTEGEVWLGLEKMHHLTTTHALSLRVDMEAWNNATLWSEYSHFSIDSEAENYKLHVSGYDTTSTGGDSLTKSLNYNNVADEMYFSTCDNDNDKKATGEYK